MLLQIEWKFAIQLIGMDNGAALERTGKKYLAQSNELDLLIN